MQDIISRVIKLEINQEEILRQTKATKRVFWILVVSWLATGTIQAGVFTQMLGKF